MLVNIYPMLTLFENMRKFSQVHGSSVRLSGVSIRGSLVILSASGELGYCPPKNRRRR
jgi:hypothetical protein